MGMLMGWATGRFGLFMIHKETVNDEPMNYAGLGLAAASLFLFAKARDLPEPEESNDSSQRFQAAKDMKKAETAVSYVADLPQVTGTQRFQKTKSAASDLSALTSISTHTGGSSGVQTPSFSISDVESVTPSSYGNSIVIADLESGVTGAGDADLESGATGSVDAVYNAPTPSRASVRRRANTAPTPTGGYSQEAVNDDDEAKKSEAPEQVKFIVGFLMAMLAGACMGYTFTPAELLAQTPGNSRDQLDYVWSNFAGIVVTGNVVLIGYILIRGEKSHMPRANVLPAIASGAIWSFAQTAWFKANQELSMVIAFPIISSLPGIIALTIGVLFLEELKTKRARVFAAAGVSVRLAGIVLIALSNTI